MPDIDLELVNDVLDGDPLLTTREAARILGIHPMTLKERTDIARIKVGQLRWRTSVIYAAQAAAQARAGRR